MPWPYAYILTLYCSRIGNLLKFKEAIAKHEVRNYYIYSTDKDYCILAF